nr:MAG TPA_asm: hypothetical protein [Caudoviricetes sp.]
MNAVRGYNPSISFRASSTRMIAGRDGTAQTISEWL